MKEYKIGYIDSIETMGLVDGPGVRIVVFMQGCPLRCIFCHNPETWHINNKMPISTKELIDKIKKYKNYFGENGGVTFSGGEPLMQSSFLLEILKMCKEENINTCLDTAGSCSFNKNILDYVDLIILDIKAYNEKDYQDITNFKMSNFLSFLDLCQKKNKKLWLRQVIIPNINDNLDYINGLADFIRPLKNVEKVELLPYHTYGVSKYKKLNIPYKLEHIKDMDIQRCKDLELKLKEKIWNN